MLTGPDDKNSADPACAIAAAATGVHCLAAPLLARVSPLLAGEGAHWLLAVVVFLASAILILQGWLTHRNFRAFQWALPGWLLLGMARAGLDGEVVLTISASALLVVAHQLNRSLGYWHTRS